jgi:hypothetical protein
MTTFVYNGEQVRRCNKCCKWIDINFKREKFDPSKLTKIFNLYNLCQDCSKVLNK